jgi:hypothetical protein
VAEEAYNELARMRASYHVVNGGKEAAYEPVILLDPVDERIKAENDAADAEAAKDSQERFESAIGFC